MQNLTNELKDFMDQQDNPSLIDIQFVKDEVFYIFRKDNKKLIYRYKGRNNFYYYQNHKNIKDSFIPLSDLKLVKCRKTKWSRLDIIGPSCEGDFSVPQRHAIDFYLKYPDNKISNLKIMYVDIELDLTDPKHRGNLSGTDTIAPICMISYSFSDNTDVVTLSLNHPNLKKKSELENNNTIFFNTEHELLMAFVRALHTNTPDILTAWNAIFDFGYILGRMSKIGLNPKQLSLLDDVDYEEKYYKISYSGFVIIDMLTLYKNYSMDVKSSYRLDDIAFDELKEKKTEYEGEIFDLFSRDPDLMIIYNKQDVDLIRRLNDKLKHIQLQNQLRQLCGLDWATSMSTIGLLDGILVKYSRNMLNSAIITNTFHHIKQHIDGAYVKSPRLGLYKWCIDLDYASLYPSIIRTFNMGPDTIYASIDKITASQILYDINSLDINNKVSITYFPFSEKEYVDEISISEIQDLIINDKIYLDISGGMYYKDKYIRSLYKTILIDLSNLRNHNKSMYQKLKKENNPEWEVYYLTQWAIKIFSNSMYGAVNNEAYRYFNPKLGESITSSGREIIKFTGLSTENYCHNNKESMDNILKKTYDQLNKETDTEIVFYTDTDSIFVELDSLLKSDNDEEKTKEILEKWAPSIENYVNVDVINAYLKVHHLDSDNNFLAVKQEWIAKHLYMTAKKKYGMWLINEEGRKIDKMKYVGLDIRRSEISKFTKKKLAILLDKLLRHDGTIDVYDIIEFHEKTQEEIIKLSNERSLEIAKTCSFSKKLKEYKQIPGHIRAMLLWNGIMKNKMFVPFSKGFIVPIKAIDTSKLKKQQVKNYLDYQSRNKYKINAISLPKDLDKIPECFVLDKQRIIDTTWTSIVDRFLAPILSIDNSMKDTW